MAPTGDALTNETALLLLAIVFLFLDSIMRLGRQINLRAYEHKTLPQLDHIPAEQAKNTAMLAEIFNAVERIEAELMWMALRREADERTRASECAGEHASFGTDDKTLKPIRTASVSTSTATAATNNNTHTVCVAASSPLVAYSPLRVKKKALALQPVPRPKAPSMPLAPYVSEAPETPSPKSRAQPLVTLKLTITEHGRTITEHGPASP